MCAFDHPSVFNMNATLMNDRAQIGHEGRSCPARAQSHWQLSRRASPPLCGLRQQDHNLVLPPGRILPSLLDDLDRSAATPGVVLQVETFKISIPSVSLLCP